MPRRRPGTTTTTSGTTSGTTTTTTTTTVSPLVDINRFRGTLGIGQSNGARTLVDAINITSVHKAKLVRMEVTVPNGGSWNFATIDAKCGAARSNGLGVMLLPDYCPQDCWDNVVYPTRTVSWPASGHTFPRAARGQTLWVSRVMALVDYIETKFPGLVMAIEWGNEPQGWEFGSARGTTPFKPEEYVSLLAIAHAALKAKYPNIISVCGGTSTGTTNGTPTDGYLSMSPATWTQVISGVTKVNAGWYDALKAAGAKPGSHFDHIAHHFYDDRIDSPWSAPFESLWNVWAGPQVWATEQSKSSDPLDGWGTAYDSEAEQYAWWLNFLNDWKFKGTKAGALFAFCVYDRQTTDKFGYFGLRTAADINKQSMTLFANANGQL